MKILQTLFKNIVMMLSTVGALLIMKVPTDPLWRPILGITILTLATTFYLQKEKP